MQDGVDLRDMQMERAIPNGHLCALRTHAVARRWHWQLRCTAHLPCHSKHGVDTSV